MTCTVCGQPADKLADNDACLACLKAAAQGCTEVTCLYHGPINQTIVDTFGPEARYGDT
jgi:hypothetical protein